MFELDTITCMDALDFLRGLPDESVNCCITSPPYWGLRSYIENGNPLKAHEIGLEDTPQAFVQRMVELFREVRRVLRADGTCWINLGDSYNGYPGNVTRGGLLSGRNQHARQFKPSGYGLSAPNLKPKDLCGIPWRVALALQDDGWWLRSAAPWVKGSAMPESVTDRATTAHEYVFQFTKSARYWFDSDAVRKENTEGTIRRLMSGPVQAMSNSPKMAQYRQDGRKDGYANPVGRNRRTSDTFYEYLDAQIAHWQYVRANGGVLVGEDTLDAFLINPKGLDLSHFASYPLALIDPCVKAGCPPQVCVACGAPWERVTERETAPYGPLTPKQQERLNHNISVIQSRGPGWRKRPQSTIQTIGWQPTCDCHASTRPGICLDPFMGAGTTALAAIQNNRHYIGSELNPEYVAMANQRIAEFDPYQDVEVQDGITQLSLFGDQP